MFLPSHRGLLLAQLLSFHYTGKNKILFSALKTNQVTLILEVLA